MKSTIQIDTNTIKMVEVFVTTQEKLAAIVSAYL
jgi:hypothetical protein